MKLKQFCIALLWLLGTSFGLQAQTYEQLWKQVDQAEKNGKPQTAIELVTRIGKKATAEKNAGQLLKATTQRMKFRNSLTPDSFYVGVQNLEQWAQTAEKPLDRAVIHSLLAEIYANYAMQNQWQLRQRTDITGEEPSADMREWSGNQFVQQVLTHSQEACKDKQLLLAASSQAYLPFVTKGATSAYYKHDMYHLLGSRAVDALETVRYIDNDTVALPEIQKLYNEMRAAYNRPGSEEAYVLATLDFLNWNRSTDAVPYRADGKLGLAQDPYLAELDQLIAQYRSFPVCAEVYLAKANYATEKREQTTAVQLCEEAIKQYPTYPRINALKEVKQTILSSELQANYPKIVYPGADFNLSVRHRNLDGITVAFFPISVYNFPKEEPEINTAFLREYASVPILQHIALERTGDYMAKDTTLVLKAPAEGVYVMQVMAKGDAKMLNTQFLYSTRMCLLTRTLEQKTYEIQVLDAQSGHPIPQATVALYTADKKPYKQLTTDEQGRCSLPYHTAYQQARIWKGADRYMPYQALNKSRTYLYEGRVNEASESITLLTDRSLYRPGQTVYVKGIAYTQQMDSAGVLTGRTYELTLYDANRQEVAKKEVRTNEFGSFAADFALPAVCLNGYYTLQTPHGRSTIRVEEYKRPTFDITFNKLEGSYQAGDRVQLNGQAQSFTGVPLQDTPVQYTINRTGHGVWKSYYAVDKLLTSGTTTLDAEGRFAIPVLLEGTGDEASARNFLYRYRVDATVTNVAGETQTSSYTIVVCKPSMMLGADLHADEPVCKEKPINVTFTAVNLDQQPLAVNGTYNLYPVTDTKKNTVAKEAALSGTFIANQAMTMSEWQSLPSGTYQLELTAKDQQGRPVERRLTVVLFSQKDTRPATETSLWYYGDNVRFDATHPATFSLGTSYKDAYVIMGVFQGDKLMEERTLLLSDSIVHFTYPYKESYGRGITVDFTFVKNGQKQNRHVQLQKRVADKQLQLKWEVFRDKLRPGQQEEWKLTVKTPQGTPASAEMLALMYDASLDKIWTKEQNLAVNYNFTLPVTQWAKGYRPSNYLYCTSTLPQLKVPGLEYDRFPYIDYMNYRARIMIRGSGAVMNAAVQEEMAFDRTESSDQSAMNRNAMPKSYAQAELKYVPVKADEEVLAEPTADLRTNFAETAFFYPQLRTNKKGEVVFSFTMPESLTRWSFRGYAHTREMLTGMLNGEATTSKEFMLTPNLPRFVRVGDKTSVAAAIANLTGKTVKGTVTLSLFDPQTEKVIATQKQSFALAAGETKGVSFQFTATDEYEVLGCRLVADGGTFSDGEQHLLPVLSNKVVLIETVAMPVRGNQTRTFALDKLFNNRSKTAANKQLTVEFTGNPAWYAVQALPSLSMPTNDNAISWATTYYANALAAYIMNSQPRIKAIFDTWKSAGGSKETFLSNLQKNQEVKNILLAESPWVLEAKNEEQQKQRIATLFDVNTVANNRTASITKLKELQLSDGSFAWYKGMQGSRYITGYIAALNARLNKLTGTFSDKQLLEMQLKAIAYVTEEATKEYKNLLKQEKEGKKVTTLSASALDYLYILALSDTKLGTEGNMGEMNRYFLAKAAGMLGTSSMMEKAKLAVVFRQAGRKQQADAFMASLKEHLVTTDELGMYFAFNENPYAWNGQPIPAHVQVMEAFDQVSNDEATVEEMKLWLLKQKQTLQWNSPVATADAVYALLCRGRSLTDAQGGARITIGDKVMDTQTSRMAGLGYIKETFTDKKTVDAQAITVAKRDAGIAWGAVYAQYQENIDKVTQQGGELNIEKKLYVERLTGTERQLQPITPQTVLRVGEKVVSRLTIRTDRALDFVQLKDQRAACFEPMATLSGYRWGNGFGYYVDVKDASTNFFFDALGKGVFVLEYAYRVARTGTYDGGMATIQSAYAPEYASHSASLSVVCE